MTEGDYEAFLYDCDGTLADNMMAHKLAYKEVAANYGIDLDLNLIHETAGWPTVLVAKEISKRYNIPLPDSFASADIDKQVQLFESKLDIADFSDPAKLSKFLTRFTSMWEVNTPTATPQSLASVLFSQPTTYGISTDVLFSIAQLRR